MGKGEVERRKSGPQTKIRKNISKKDFERQLRAKKHQRLEKFKERKAVRDKEAQLKKLAKSK